MATPEERQNMLLQQSLLQINRTKEVARDIRQELEHTRTVHNDAVREFDRVIRQFRKFRAWRWVAGVLLLGNIAVSIWL